MNRFPEIAPVSGEVFRPLWSVMIPAYNCADTLRETLKSVLSQDPGPGNMQIEVVDDGSATDDLRKVVEELGAGRVSYFRQPGNMGAVQNFNDCIHRSRGHLIHILHADDFVENGFYEKIHNLSLSVPQASFFCVRAWVFRDSKKIAVKSLPLKWMKECSRNAAPLFYINRVRTPSVVIRRSFYEQHGGFDPALKHVADWEMWIRAIRRGGGVFLDELLAWYRSANDNDTARLQLSAENLRDWVRLLHVLRSNYCDFQPLKFLGNLILFGLFQILFLLFSGKCRASVTTLAFLWRGAIPIFLDELITASPKKRLIE